MCMFKSAIILKDRVFIPDHDHHTQMLEELSIKDNRQNAETLFVRAELIPPNGDVFSDIDTWQFKVDQDIRPKWFVEEYEAGRMTAAVKDWAKDRVYIGVDNLNLTIGTNYYLKDCKNVTLSENVNVRMCDSASITDMCGSASITDMYGSASITRMYGSASITRMYGSASITDMYGSASITRMCGSASITRMCDSASITDMYGSASITDMCDSASITRMYGSASITRMYGSASITDMCGSASITDMCGSASITDMYGSASITDMCGSASITDMCGSASITDMYGSASITDMCDSASITDMYGSASITDMYGSALLAISEIWADNIKVESILLCDNATIKDNRTKTIYQSGDWKLVRVENIKESEGPHE